MFHTLLLRCDSAAISFSSTNHDLPLIACQKTSAALASAARLLNQLHLVAFPTETVYGLGALALNPQALAAIFSTKGRPADNPLIVHVSSLPMLHSLLPKAYSLSPAYQALIKHFWPGPLTLLFPRDPNIIPTIVTAGQPSVAVRFPSHPVARALIAVANCPLAAPSANSSGKPSPTKAEHVLHDLNTKVPLILDGGSCDVGLESTVVDGLHADGNIRVLRPGGITVEDIERVLTLELAPDNSCRVLVHKRDYKDQAIEHAPTTPGMKYRHYSPSVPVTLLHTLTPPPPGLHIFSASSFISTLRNPNGIKSKVGVLAPVDSRLWESINLEEKVQWHKYPLGSIAQPSVTAQRLFDGLLTLEQEGVDLIIIEEISEEREGLAVMNRVRKAAGESKWIAFQ